MIRVSVTFQQIYLKISKLKLLETILVTQGKAQQLFYHQQRLNRSFKELFVGATPPQLQLFPPLDGKTYRCRFIYDDKSNEVSYHEYQPTYETLYHFKEIDFSYKYKYLNRDTITKATQKLPTNAATIFVKDNLILDTAIANIACLIDGLWYTPRHPLHKGTTRARLLDEKKIQTADISIEDCQKAQKLAFFNALTGFYELPILSEAKVYRC